MATLGPQNFFWGAWTACVNKNADLVRTALNDLI